MDMKSLTGSRKIIEMMSKFGYCIGYQQVEKLETYLATSLDQKCQKTQEGIITEQGLSTALAWDNYDEMNETLSGSGTLHDCIGICYQNLSSHKKRPTATHDGTLPLKRKQKLTLEVDSHIEFEPYRKNPKITGFNYAVKSVHKPDSLRVARKQALLWSVMCTMYFDIPMWTGWNSTGTHDPLPKQYIGYMANIEFQPTILDVVAETLRVSHKVAAECGEKYAIVHYDLAIAKPAKQIQQEESPTFDNVFICFGPFHIQMAFFASLGYIIDGSGGPHILTETDVLSSGSLKSLLSGKHYNRCKRLHMLMLQLDNLKSYNDFIQIYEAYCERTRSGEHGMTARFWMQYIGLVQLYFLFSRACHSNDIDLFIYCIVRLASIFFATNRPNYARWMVRYQLDLIYIDITSLADDHGSEICHALPGVHAFTGCDYTAAMVRRGKIKPLNLAKKEQRFQDAFSSLGAIEKPDQKTKDILEEFVCSLYGRKATSVNKARYDIFRARYSPRSIMKPLDKIKGVDASALPPCKQVLEQKILRTNIVTYLWKHAHQSVPLELDPAENGYTICDGHYSVRLFEGPQLPNDIAIDTIEEEEDAEEDITYNVSTYEEDDTDTD